MNGTSENKVPPDEVILALGVESRDKDLTVAKANNDTIVKKVLALAHGAGIEPKNIQTSALSIGPGILRGKNSQALPVSNLADDYRHADGRVEI